MDDLQRMLAEFHEKHGQGTTGTTAEMWNRRAHWTLEEAYEFLDAVLRSNRISMAAALADIVYLCYGSAHRMGIDLTACIREVHRSNMTKEVGADGKAVKGPNYSPPDIDLIIYEEEISKGYGLADPYGENEAPGAGNDLVKDW